jgi:trehalose 2-sulfotransferase
MARESLVFCSTPRSGSTFICNALASAGAIPKPDEWLHTDRLMERRQAYGLSGTEVEDYALIREIVRREVNPSGIFSIKLMWPQLTRLLGITQIPTIENRTRALRSIFELFPNPTLIHITRANSLRQAISWARAIKTGVWHHLPGLNKPLPAHFDFVLVRSLIDFIDQENQAWRVVLDEAGCPTRAIVYEDFVLNPADYTLKFFSGLGMNLMHFEAIWDETAVASDGLNALWEQAYYDILGASQEAERSNGVRFLPLKHLSAWADPFPLTPMDCGSKCEVVVTVLNTSDELWPAIGGTDGSGWLTLQLEWVNRTTNNRVRNPDLGYLEKDVPGGSSINIPLLLTAPMEPGSYDLEVRLVQTENPENDRLAAPFVVLRVEVDIQPWRRAFQAYFGECAVSAQVLHVSPWFGSFLPFHFPWIEHQVHGWIRCIDGFGLERGVFRFEDSELGVIETTPNRYPEVMLLREGRVLRLESYARDERLFIDVVSGELRKVPLGIKR